ncbi:hypothetical protein ABT116_49005, partial [Streptomyces sp. NPDC002130]|uniref:hypothetical protein n=1 Tax=Streptomyces sp. NPDC002130 TaxID=3155568 RepID=UPI0033242925
GRALAAHRPEPLGDPRHERRDEVDLNTLDRITALIDEGVNVVGVRLILSLEAQNALLEARLGQFSGAGPLQRERRLRRE